MALNSTGPISLAGTTAGQSIELENGGNGTTQISLNDAAVRALAGVASGAITMPTDFYGKANRVSISYTFTANTANATLNLSTISGYSSGKSDITVTINSGVYLYATSTGSYGLNLSGGTTGDTLTIVNNGFILGCGGNAPSTTSAGAAGGPALNFGFGMASATVNNTNASAYIAGGGGSGSTGVTFNYFGTGGGGAGGGLGFSDSNNGTRPSRANPGSTGYAGADASFSWSGSGGMVLPGVGGSVTFSGFPIVTTVVPAGAGGAGLRTDSNNGKGWATGGSGNSAGSTALGVAGKGNAGSAGGGWGASGGANNNNGQSGGAGGKAVNLNGKSITWTSGNTTRVYGAVS